MSTDGFSSKSVYNTPSLNSASITVTSINTQSLVGQALSVSSLASSGDITCGGNFNGKWTVGTDISGSGNIYAKSLYLMNDISNNGSISTNGNLYVKGQNVGSQLSQWVTSGSSVYYNGNVSVNKITNAYALDVSGSLNLSGAIRTPSLPNVKAFINGSFYYGINAETPLPFNGLDASFNNIGFVGGTCTNVQIGGGTGTNGVAGSSTYGVFTCPIAGFYVVYLTFMSYMNNSCTVYLYKNNVLYYNDVDVYNGGSGNVTEVARIYQVISLNVGDTLKFTVNLAYFNTVNYNSLNSNLNIYYLRAA